MNAKVLPLDILQGLGPRVQPSDERGLRMRTIGDCAHSHSAIADVRSALTVPYRGLDAPFYSKIKTTRSAKKSTQKKSTQCKQPELTPLALFAIPCIDSGKLARDVKRRRCNCNLKRKVPTIGRCRVPQQDCGATVNEGKENQKSDRDDKSLDQQFCELGCHFSWWCTFFSPSNTKMADKKKAVCEEFTMLFPSCATLPERSAIDCESSTDSIS